MYRRSTGAGGSVCTNIILYSYTISDLDNIETKLKKKTAVFYNNFILTIMWNAKRVLSIKDFKNTQYINGRKIINF